MSEARVSLSLNGVDLTTVVNLAAQMDTNPELAQELSGYARRVRVRWVDGFHSQAYTRDVPSHTYDEPAWLGGKNRAMAASEAVLGAIGGCIPTRLAGEAPPPGGARPQPEIGGGGAVNPPAVFCLPGGHPRDTPTRGTNYT